MDRNTYRIINVAQLLQQAFPKANTGDSVLITIYDADDNATDVNQASMSYESGVWTYSWTPAQLNRYFIRYYNVNQDVEHYEYVTVVGSLIGTPSASSGGSTLENLRSRFLKYIDNYNANDLSGTNSSGELADLYINEALQTIYAEIKNSRFLDSYASTSLVSTADQAYIALSAITDLDNLTALKDTDNQITLMEISPWKYFLEVSSPSERTGTPYRYTRIFDRIYLDPVPSDAITYTTEYKKTYARLSGNSDTALISFKYDPWIYAETRVLWLMGEDPSNTAAIVVAQEERERVKEIFLRDIMSEMNTPRQLASHFDRTIPRGIRFEGL